MKHLYITLLIVGIFSLNLSASTALSSFDPPVKLEVLEKDFPLFKDLDDKILYVDFELINTNLKSLKILNDQEQISFQENVNNRSVDEIYEIDYSNLEAGSYKIVLDTYLGNELTAHIEIK